MKLRLLLGVLVLGLASACGGGDDDGGGGGSAGGGGGGDGTLMVTLEAQGGSGKSGTAELHPGPASVDVTLEVQPGSEGEPFHVHKAKCGGDMGEVVHDLGFTTAGLGQGQIFETIDKVATGEYVIDVHKANGEDVVLCGQIPARE